MLDPQLLNPEFYWSFFVHQLQENDMFSGMFVLSSMGTIAYAMRSVPGKIWAALQYQFTVELKVQNDDPIYESLKLFLSRTSYVERRCRRLTLASFTQYALPSPPSAIETISSTRHGKSKPEPQSYTLTPMDGTHLFFYRGHPILYTRTIEENQAALNRKETIVLKYMGRSRKLINQLIKDIEDLTRSDRHTVMVFNGFHDYWTCVGEKLKRPLDTVYIPEEQKKMVLDDIQWFYDNPHWYKQRGIPYHRGYLFHGPPGTGKTSFIKAICSHLDKKLAICNLNAVDNDTELMELMSCIPSDSIVVIEDIDACFVTESRQIQNGKKDGDEKFGITLAGILNALDGVMTPENQIFIMTTNHPERLDPALLRPGRVDVRLEFKSMDAGMVQKMFVAFFPEYKRQAKKIAAILTENGNCSPAEIQKMFFEYAKTPKDFIKNVTKRGIDFEKSVE